MEIKINNETYQIKSGKEEEVRSLFSPYKKESNIEELYEIDLARIIIEGFLFRISEKIFMENIYPSLKDLTQETLKKFKTARWV
ncbi:hypothetical protein J4429_06195 [Candidatus Pacearchaeota archaeon]|nr:hypothetical protein [Candidatus Pacearchaeota archaeon]